LRANLHWASIVKKNIALKTIEALSLNMRNFVAQYEKNVSRFEVNGYKFLISGKSTDPHSFFSIPKRFRGGFAMFAIDREANTGDRGQ
jgi:hypothetical protein